MTRVWIYDLNYTKKYREAAAKAEQDGREPPARWQVSWYDNTSELTTETIATKPRAEARQSEVERSLQDRTNVDPAVAEVTFTEVADEWLDARRDLRMSAWLKYRGLLDNHVLPRWGDLSLSAVLHADEDIEVWAADLLKSTDDGGSGLQASQVRRIHRTLAMALNSYAPNESRITPPIG